MGAAFALVAVIPFVPRTAGAQDAAPTAAPETPRCDTPEYRQFDFWIGRWEVTGPDGRVAGRNSITRELDGCVIHERWEGGGVRGESFNIWDRARRQWHQTWVSSQGTLLMLDGGLRHGVMQMTGESGPPDRRILNRITWTPGADGSVRQLWEISADDGATWRVVFDGSYRRLE